MIPTEAESRALIEAIEHNITDLLDKLRAHGYSVSWNEDLKTCQILIHVSGLGIEMPTLRIDEYRLIEPDIEYYNAILDHFKEIERVLIDE